ncbi:MAG: sugar transferase [Bacillota bacterium]
MIKRLFDIVISSTALILLSPVFLLTAILIKLESKGPVFYRGLRVGRYGKLFKIYKFRSMVDNAEKTGVSSTSNHDMRITRMGKIIRKFKLDEFSQLINVFVGQMSLVGPRPQVKRYVDEYSEEEKKTLSLRPGITDWASIKFNDEGSIIEDSGIEDPDEAYSKLIHPIKMKYQLKYLNERSIWIDFKILVFTVLTVISTRLGGKPLGVPQLDDEKNKIIDKG